ncbi:MAG: hypothetical protein AAGA72_05180 [Pseudomonadota bacterium]
MSTPQNKGPEDTIRDGAVFVKIWRNWSNKGEPFYSANFGRTYTDKATGQIKESQSFQGTDILKLQSLSNRAYESIARMREADRNLEQQVQQTETQSQRPPAQATHPQQGDMAAARDAAMGHSQPSQQAAQPQQPVHDPVPGREL